jgi:hypothetical protein
VDFSLLERPEALNGISDILYTKSGIKGRPALSERY